MWPVKHRQPIRALSFDGLEQRAPSSDLSGQDFMNIIQESANGPAPALSEAEQQNYAAYRAEIRSTLNHFQLSGIQVSLTDSQEAERERDGKRMREHKRVMEMLCRMEGQQMAIKSRLEGLQESMTLLSRSLVSAVKRLDQRDDDERKEAGDEQLRWEDLTRLHNGHIEALGDRFETLACNQRRLEEFLKFPRLPPNTTHMSGMAVWPILGSTGGFGPVGDRKEKITVSRSAHPKENHRSKDKRPDDTRVGPSGAIRKPMPTIIGQKAPMTPPKRSRLVERVKATGICDPSSTDPLQTEDDAKTPHTPPRKSNKAGAETTEHGIITPADAAKSRVIRRTYGRVTKRLD